MCLGDNPENDAARIEQLLRLGAHAIMQGGGEGGGGSGGGAGEAAGEEKGFAAEDIEQVGPWTYLGGGTTLSNGLSPGLTGITVPQANISTHSC